MNRRSSRPARAGRPVPWVERRAGALGGAPAPRILRAARDLSLERFRCHRNAEIADAARLSPGNLYNYFHGKEEILTSARIESWTGCRGPATVRKGVVRSLTVGSFAVAQVLCLSMRLRARRLF
jgi:hypothetical protein